MKAELPGRSGAVKHSASADRLRRRGATSSHGLVAMLASGVDGDGAVRPARCGRAELRPTRPLSFL